MSDYGDLDYGDLAQWASDPFSLTADAVGDDTLNNACLDQCWKAYFDCLQSATDGGLQCLASLNVCRRNC
jgi:hypothetical protein